MKNFVIISLVLFSAINVSVAQNVDSLLNVLHTKFESFEYEEVIYTAQILLQNKDKIPEKVVLEIYRLKAVAEFSILNEDSAKESLLEILKIEPDYLLDPLVNSPKIISLFNELKTALTISETQETSDSLNFNKEDQINNLSGNEPSIDIYELKTEMRSSIARSLILPGWGHLYRENSTKGWILTSTSFIVLSSMIYFIFDCNSKENDYLQEKNKIFINEKYKDYNTAYKLRNLSVAVFSGLWIYSQIDLLYFSNDKKISASLIPTREQTDQVKYNLQLTFSF